MRHICFETILQRTKAVPLSITYRRPTLPFAEPHSLSRLFDVDRQRIRSLHIYASSTKRLVDTLRDPFPSLESLFVSFSAVNESDEGFDGNEVDGIDTDDDLDQYRNDLEDLPATYPGLSSPVSCIKTLTLVGFPFPKTPFRFAPQLTSLVISLPVRYNSHFVHWSALYPSMEEFVEVLKGTPTLTTIDFRHCTPQDFVHAPPETVPREICLPNLRNVTLIATRDGLNSMLSFIKVPNARLRVGLYGLPDDVEEHLSAIFAAIKYSACRDITALRSLDIYIEMYKQRPRVVVSSSPVVSWNLSHDPDELFADHQTGTTGFDIDKREPEFAFGFQLAGTSAVPLLTTVINVMKAFDHTAVEHLSIRHSKQCDTRSDLRSIRQFWFYLIRGMINLRHLSIQHFVLDSRILQMLLLRCADWERQMLGVQSSPRMIEDGDASKLHLPKLSTLEFVDVDLMAEVAELTRILELRRNLADEEAGANGVLQKMALRECSLPWTKDLRGLNQLRGLVVEVVLGNVKKEPLWARELLCDPQFRRW